MFIFLETKAPQYNTNEACLLPKNDNLGNNVNFFTYVIKYRLHDN